MFAPARPDGRRFPRVAFTFVVLLWSVLAPRLTRAQTVPVLRVGETLTYDAKYDGPLFVSAGGRGTMAVVGIDTVNGREAYHVAFTFEGGLLWFHIRDRYDSWIDRERFVSLRFWQELYEGKRRRSRHYEIFPERGVFVENDKPERRTVAQPLDDASLLYAIRTMPLDSGGRYDVPRYFIPDRNPITLIVKRRERVTLTAGTFDAVVVQPLIKTTGLFGEGGQAELWFSDDERRYLLRLTAKVSFGSVHLTLRSIELPRGSSP
jgi:uncharacterized protein DUF3108